MTGQIQMPPCGAAEVTPKAMVMAPVTTPPAMHAGITRRGSAAANGMAPSEMKEAPSSHEVLPFSRSAGVKYFRPSTVEARASPSGGTMPAAITVAMISWGAVLAAVAVPSPATANE